MRGKGESGSEPVRMIFQSRSVRFAPSNRRSVAKKGSRLNGAQLEMERREKGKEKEVGQRRFLLDGLLKSSNVVEHFLLVPDLALEDELADLGQHAEVVVELAEAEAFHLPNAIARDLVLTPGDEGGIGLGLLLEGVVEGEQLTDHKRWKGERKEEEER